MAVGTSRNQFKNAPVVGHLMAELIDACESGNDHDAEPLRVTCRHTGHELGVGFYSPQVGEAERSTHDGH